MPIGAYDNWGPPVEVTTWKQSGEPVGALGQVGGLSALGDLRLGQGIERILIVAYLAVVVDIEDQTTTMGGKAQRGEEGGG